ncbi:MAG: DUF7210 family protein [Methylobacter sp.]
MAEQPEKKAPTVEVTLLMPHEDGGKPFNKGEKITVTESQANWLRGRGVVAQNPTGVK